MTIASPVFQNNMPIPTTYTGKGQNISPPLQFAEIPAGAKSLVLIVQDVDSGEHPWVHWLVFNIPPVAAEVAEGTIPQGGTEGHANGGTPGYEGPNQIYFKGTHHYQFGLYALDCRLELPDTADRSLVEPAIKGHILAESVLTGTASGTGEALDQA